MKNRFLLITALAVGLLFYSCSKSNAGLNPINPSSINFTANDSLVSFPVSNIFLEDVLNVKTTVFIGQYPDSLNKLTNISIRVIGDTTGRFSNDSLLVTYTNSQGIVFTNTGDSSNYVQIAKFPKTANGIVTGTFSVNMANAKDTIKLLKGTFTALYQD